MKTQNEKRTIWRVRSIYWWDRTGYRIHKSKTHVSFDVLNPRLLVLGRKHGVEAPDPFAYCTCRVEEVLVVIPDYLEFQPLESLQIKKKPVRQRYSKSSTSLYHRIIYEVRIIYQVRNMSFMLPVKREKTRTRTHTHTHTHNTHAKNAWYDTEPINIEQSNHKPGLLVGGLSFVVSLKKLCWCVASLFISWLSFTFLE